MTELNFDIYAMVKPKTEDDILLLLRELQLELENLRTQFASMLGPQNE